MIRMMKLRQQLGYTIEEMAHDIGIPFSTYYAYESCRRMPSIKNCYKIMKYAAKYDKHIKLEEFFPFQN